MHPKASPLLSDGHGVLLMVYSWTCLQQRKVAARTAPPNQIMGVSNSQSRGGWTDVCKFVQEDVHGSKGHVNV